MVPKCLIIIGKNKINQSAISDRIMFLRFDLQETTALKEKQEYNYKFFLFFVFFLKGRSRMLARSQNKWLTPQKAHLMSIDCYSSGAVVSCVANSYRGVRWHKTAVFFSSFMTKSICKYIYLFLFLFFII